MVISVIDLLAAVALVALVSGIGGVTYRAVMLLVQLIPPKRHWIERGVFLSLLAAAYIGMIALDVPSVLASLRTGEHSTVESVLRTAIFAAYLWTLTTILLMLARGRLGEQPKWRRP